MTVSANRLANLDLLRIIAMFFIVVTHCVMYGVIGISTTEVYVDLRSTPAVANWAGLYLIMYLTAVGVNCFVMASGYLLAENTRYRWKSVGRTWLTTFFYSFGICLILLIAGRTAPKDLLASAFPVYTNQYWFMTMFIGLQLVSPFLSKLVSVLDKREYLIMLAVLSVLNLRLFKFPYGGTYGGGMTLVWFVYLFLVGAYVRKFKPFASFRHFGKCFWAFGALLAGAYMTLSLVMWKVKGAPVCYGSTFNNGFTFITSLLFFLWAVNMQISSDKVSGIISGIAPCMFGVYLISENPHLRFIVWDEIIRLQNMLNNPWLLPLVLAASVAVFLTCCVIDKLRIQLFGIFHIL